MRYQKLSQQTNGTDITTISRSSSRHNNEDNLSTTNNTTTSTTTAVTKASSKIGIHEISTQSIIETTSALLQSTFVVTPTSMNNGGSCNNNDVLDEFDSDDENHDEDYNEFKNYIRDDSDDDDHHEYGSNPSKNMKEKSNNRLTDNNNVNNNQQEISNLFMNHDILLNEEQSILVESPIYEPKEVRFSPATKDAIGNNDTILVPSLSLDDDDEDEDGNNHQIDEQIRIEQERETTILHEQLRNALSNLSNEKNIRMKKERLIIKLAKELQKRKYDLSSYERKCIYMTSIINQLRIDGIEQQQRVDQEKNSRVQDILPKEQPNPAEKAVDDLIDNADCDDDQKKKLLEDVDESLVNKNNQVQIDQLRTELTNMKTMIQTLEKEKESLLLTIQEQHQQKARTNVVFAKYQKIAATSTTRTTSTFLHRMMWLGLFLLVVNKIVMMSIVSTGSASMSLAVTRTKPTKMQTFVKNVLCAPIRPGTRLVPQKGGNVKTTLQVSSYEAPWWVPPKKNLKQFIYNIVCSKLNNGNNSIVRSKIEWRNDNGQIMIYHIENHETKHQQHNIDSTNKLIFQGRGPMGVLFDVWDGSIHLLQQQSKQAHTSMKNQCHQKKSRNSIHVPAPWTN